MEFDATRLTTGRDRRAFLKAAAVGLGAALWPGCAPRPFVVGPAQPRRRFVPVEVSSDRIIRTMAGLRPFRPSGFVLRAERRGDKLLVHNYGHGGGGVTLSWGTARLAVDELDGWSGARDRAAIIGCGIGFPITDSNILLTPQDIDDIIAFLRLL